MTYDPKYLGKTRQYEGLDPIPVENPPDSVTMTSNEVTAMCPLTGQPDMYEVTINFAPKNHLCESKSLKLYFQSLRDKGIFAEQLAVDTAELFFKEIQPHGVRVTVEQKARGGVAIVATSERPPNQEMSPIFAGMVRIPIPGNEPEPPKGPPN